MKRLINIENVSEIAELLKDIPLSCVQLDKQQKAPVYIDAVHQAWQDFTKPFSEKASTIVWFERHLQDFIRTTQMLFDLLDKKTQQKILKKVGCKSLEEINS